MVCHPSGEKCRNRIGKRELCGPPPLKVSLNKGWNKVLLKLPVGKFKMEEVRLVKWMFTTVFVTLDGEDAVKGLVYSPERKIQ